MTSKASDPRNLTAARRPSAQRAPSRSRAAVRQVWANVVSAALAEAHNPSLDQLNRIGPLLVDSRYHDRLDDALDLAASGAASLPIGVLYALGRRASVRGDDEEARLWLARAEVACADETPTALRARIAFELGCLHLRRGGTEAAESILASLQKWSPQATAEVAQLHALVAEGRGERAVAIDLYRAALAAGTDLTPMTRALAARNLADALAHQDPTEAYELYGRCLDLLFVNELDMRLEASVRNCLGYTLICLGRIDDAQVELQRAYELAEEDRRRSVQACTLFNMSIAHELRDDLAWAEARLADALALLDKGELATWCSIRLAWLELKQGHVDAAHSFWRDARISGTHSHTEALLTLEAFFALRASDPRQAMRLFTGLAQRYHDHSDLVTAFVLFLWSSVAARRSGMLRAASSAQKHALEIERRKLIRLSPNWWAAEVSTEGVKPEEQLSCTRHRVVSAVASVSSPRVVVRGSRITVDGSEVASTSWQHRTGSRVLRQLLEMLVRAYPGGVQRVILIDMLWPESDGDHAVANVYSATKDLRRILANVPGLRISREGDVYRLDADPNVRFDRSG